MRNSKENSSLILVVALLSTTACGSKTQVKPGGTDGGIVTDCPLDQATAPNYACGFVSRKGVQLMLGGVNYRSVGFNRYELAGGPLATRCQHTPDPNAYSAYVKDFMLTAANAGTSVVRFWAFQNYAGPQGTDYSAFDEVVAAARQNGVRLIPVFENTYADCSEPQTGDKESTWLTTGYKAPYGAYALSLPDYVKGVVTHFKDDPTIAMWQIINEGKYYQAPNLLAAFLDDVATQIKAIDANHLVSGGASLQCWQGAQGVTDFKSYSTSAAIDVLDQHDYGSDDTAWPDCLAGALQAATALTKPLIIGEAGINANDSTSTTTRASYFDAKLKAAAQKGIQQYLIWELNNAPNYPDAMDLLKGDPGLQTLQDASQSSFKN